MKQYENRINIMMLVYNGLLETPVSARPCTTYYKSEAGNITEITCKVVVGWGGMSTVHAVFIV